MLERQVSHILYDIDERPGAAQPAFPGWEVPPAASKDKPKSTKKDTPIKPKVAPITPKVRVPESVWKREPRRRADIDD